MFALLFNRTVLIILNVCDICMIAGVPGGVCYREGRPVSTPRQLGVGAVLRWGYVAALAVLCCDRRRMLVPLRGSSGTPQLQLPD